MTALTTVIVTTYNRGDYLRLTLESLRRQDYTGAYEIVVGDDGSSDHTDKIVEQALQENDGPCLRHVKQDDLGFRKAKILNESVRKGAQGNLLIFIDSDCLPDLNFVRSYAEHFADKAFYLGGVYNLSQEFTENLLSLAEPIPTADIIAQARMSENQKSGASRRVRKRYWKSRIYTALRWRRPKIWGGNFAVNRDVFEAVNGFDENYVGYGQEDSDIRDRLLKGGYRPVCLHTLARTFHLWHDVTEAHKETGMGGRLQKHNRAYYNRGEAAVVCRKGLRQLPE